LIFDSDVSIYSLPGIDIDNDYDDFPIVNSIKNPKITNSYSKKLFTCTVDSFGIVGDGIFSEFFDGFDDPLAVLGIEFFDEVP
jgi:hypothetical protein